MSIGKRRDEIAQLLMAEGKIKVSELAKCFRVSTETIRKDLIYLDKEGIVKKNRGSAEVLNEFCENDYSQKSTKHINQKKAIGIEAAKLVPEGAIVFMDAGSSTYYVATQLILRKDITVVTNFIPIAQLLHNNGIKVVLIGGEMRAVSAAATGMFAKYCISNINADIAFIGTSGFKNAKGPCVENFPEAEVKKCMLEHSANHYLVADSSKAECSAMAKITEWEDFDLFITDDGISRENRELIEKNVELLVVATQKDSLVGYSEEDKKMNSNGGEQSDLYGNF